MLVALLFLMVITADQGYPQEKNTGNSKEYKIGVGDVLKISTWKEEDLSFDAVQVRIDGKITFPLIDAITG